MYDKSHDKLSSSAVTNKRLTESSADYCRERQVKHHRVERHGELYGLLRDLSAGRQSSGRKGDGDVERIRRHQWRPHGIVKDNRANLNGALGSSQATECSSAVTRRAVTEDMA